MTSRIHPRDAGIQHTQINKCDYILSMEQRKNNHVIIPINAEKTLDKIQYPFMIKSLKKTEIDDLFSAIYDKPMASIRLNGQKLKVFSLTSGT